GAQGAGGARRARDGAGWVQHQEQGVGGGGGRRCERGGQRGEGEGEGGGEREREREGGRGRWAIRIGLAQLAQVGEEMAEAIVWERRGGARQGTEEAGDSTGPPLLPTATSGEARGPPAAPSPPHPPDGRPPAPRGKRSAATT